MPIDLLTSGLERFERTQSITMRAAPWEVREAGLPEPLWKLFLTYAFAMAALIWLAVTL